MPRLSPSQFKRKLVDSKTQAEEKTLQQLSQPQRICKETPSFSNTRAAESPVRMSSISPSLSSLSKRQHSFLLWIGSKDKRRHPNDGICLNIRLNSEIRLVVLDGSLDSLDRFPMDCFILNVQLSVKYSPSLISPTNFHVKSSTGRRTGDTLVVSDTLIQRNSPELVRTCCG